MNGKGRALDNIYIERFWRSIEREKIHLNPTNGGLHLYQIVKEYVKFYNEKRPHQGIDDVPPNQMFYQLKKSA